MLFRSRRNAAFAIVPTAVALATSGCGGQGELISQDCKQAGPGEACVAVEVDRGDHTLVARGSIRGERLMDLMLSLKDGAGMTVRSSPSLGKSADTSRDVETAPVRCDELDGGASITFTARYGAEGKVVEVAPPRLTVTKACRIEALGISR